MFYNRIRQKIVSGASRKNLKYEWYQNTNDHSVTCRRLSIVIFICVVMVILQFNKPVSNHLKISIRRTKVQLILIFRLNHVFSRRFVQILQPIFRQFVNLINHNTIQRYSRWNRSNCMLSEEKEQRKLINANVITRHNTIVIMCDEQLQISSFSLFKHFPINVSDLTIKLKNWNN